MSSQLLQTQPWQYWKLYLCNLATHSQTMVV